MNRPELYTHSVDTLYQAYFNDTLEHGNCEACAVGNILKEASKKTGVPNFRWNNLFVTVVETDEDGIVNHRQQVAGKGEVIASHPFFGIRPIRAVRKDHVRSLENAHKLVAASGYTTEELARIEYAFETAPKGESKEDYMFNGLAAVLGVLKDIHQVEEGVAEEKKASFRKHYETLSA